MTRRARITTAVAIAASLTLLGCGTSEDDTSPSGETTTSTPQTSNTIPSELPTLDPSTVDVDDPDEVVVAVLETMYSYLPAVDQTPNDAMVRASSLFSEEMAAGVRDYQPPTGPGREWQRWADTNTLVTATAEISPQQRPSDTDRALRYVTVQQTTSTKFSSQELAPIHLVVSLERASEGWRLASILQR
ncbi:hypothetical protein [Rhodococcus sp. HS-D2]|uniref:hypothetical protein n=1 Tax=Rhodococcus sp. HS-D2 TaxID=1384636 RepID=UPI0007D95C78|nr:hypothetical protein [Rhodococcus sp. HS-D2]